jgi:hypothetical protein
MGAEYIRAMLGDAGAYAGLKPWRNPGVDMSAVFGCANPDFAVWLQPVNVKKSNIANS